MVEVRLHGALARDFGKVWNLAVSSPTEAVHAIDKARRGFRKAIMALDGMGYVFRVRSNKHDHDNTDVNLTHVGVSRIDIIPVVRGASAALRFVVGALLVISTFIPFSPTFGNTFVQAAGFSLMLGAVTEWLTPVPKRQSQGEGKDSWTISGPTNTVDQGVCVPVIYGEVLTGGYAISAGLVASQVSSSGSIAPEIQVSGITEYVVRAGRSIYVESGGNPFLYPPEEFVELTVQVGLSVSTFNISDPITYQWSYSGFAGLTEAVVIDDTSATMELQLKFVVPAETEAEVVGTLSVQVNGLNTNDVNAEVPTPVSITEEQEITITIDTIQYFWESGG